MISCTLSLLPCSSLRYKTGDCLPYHSGLQLFESPHFQEGFERRWWIGIRLGVIDFQTDTNHVIMLSCEGKINKLSSFEKEEALFMSSNVDIKAAQVFYRDNMNNFTYFVAYAVQI